MGTKKVILNKSNGKFSVSPRAYIEYAKKTGINLFFYTIHEWGNVSHGTILRQVSEEDISNSKTKIDGVTFSACNKDCGSNPTWIEIEDNEFYLDSNNREDSVLISVVEELGDEASGIYSHLVVVEIPDDMPYYIENDSGYKTLCEEIVQRRW